MDRWFSSSMIIKAKWLSYYNVTKYELEIYFWLLEIKSSISLLTAEDFFCDLYLQFRAEMAGKAGKVW